MPEVVVGTLMFTLPLQTIVASALGRAGAARAAAATAAYAARRASRRDVGGITVFICRDLGFGGCLSQFVSESVNSRFSKFWLKSCYVRLVLLRAQASRSG